MAGLPTRTLAIAAILASATFAGGCGGHSTTPDTAVPPSSPAALDPLFDDIERRTFDFFWETTNATTGLVPDRYPTPSFSSIAAIGFGLTAYPVGVERGYVTRAEARERVLTTLRFLHEAPQGPEPSGNSGYQGFFYHFLNPTTGTRYATNELSTIDTALLMAGVLFTSGYFDDAANVDEAEIRRLADDLYRAVDWHWASPNPPGVTMAWRPEDGFARDNWRGYNEAMILYILALGSPTHPAADGAWNAWTATYGDYWGELEGETHLTFGPLFGHQYSHVWIDFRGIHDDYMAQRGFDYFENSRRAVVAQRAYAIRNPLQWRGYGVNVWGLTACDGPVDADLPYRNETRRFHTYAARGVDTHYSFDDGTIAPTAAIASLPFAPELVGPATLEMHRAFGAEIYGKYGFFDAFNPSYDFDRPPTQGRRIPGFGWIDTDYLGIDQGPIVAMIENQRSELIWRVMKRNPYIRRGLERAGFKGGWLQ